MVFQINILALLTQPEIRFFQKIGFLGFVRNPIFEKYRISLDLFFLKSYIYLRQGTKQKIFVLKNQFFYGG